MDEVSFGPSREARPPSRRRRAFTAAASVGAVAPRGAALAVTAPSSYHALTSRYPATPSAPPAALSHLPSKGCPPARAAWPSLAGLPAGLRPGAVPVIVDAQFSGRCTAP